MHLRRPPQRLARAQKLSSALSPSFHAQQTRESSRAHKIVCKRSLEPVRLGVGSACFHPLSGRECSEDIFPLMHGKPSDSTLFVHPYIHQIIKTSQTSSLRELFRPLGRQRSKSRGVEGTKSCKQKTTTSS